MNPNLEIDEKEIRELLNKNWMTHDAMWFFHCMQELGMETTNKINKAAVNSMAGIEAKRYQKLLGIKEIKTFESLKAFIKACTEILQPKFMKFEISFPDENKMLWEMHQCFAHDGVQKIGVLDQYECGIFERPKAWFNTLGLEYQIIPEIIGCMMPEHGKCCQEFIFNF